MKIKKILSLILTLAMIISTISVAVFADENSTETVSYAADVGGVQYTTIDEALKNWTNGKTLTLLSDVMLPDAFQIKSTEHHILNLDTYTMTAASGKNAFEIIACGTGDSERYAITINADADNPGTLDAGKKSVIYYDYSKGGISGNDRPIIKINGGIFVGSTSLLGTAGIYAKGTAARKCATLNISGGTFNCSILGTGKSKMLISGGNFNYSVSSYGDSTCYRLISGGRFKSFGFMTADAANKFGVGSALGTYDVGVYVDDEGYLVVGGPVITEVNDKYGASIPNYSCFSSYLKYSSAAENGLYYTNAEMAFEKIKDKGEITLNTSYSEDITTKGNLTIDMSAENANYNGNVTLGRKADTFTVVFDSEKPYNGTVTPYTGCALKVTETMGTIITRVYSNVKAVAKIGNTNYASLEEAVEKVKDNETITLLEDIELDNTLSIDREVAFTLDGDGKNIKASENFTATDSALVFGNSNFDITAAATHNYTIKNIKFEGWTTDHVIRTQGATVSIEGCSFTNNTQSGANLAILSFAKSKPSVKDCDFINNNCLKVLDFGSWGVNENILVDNCTFENNICSVTGVINLHSGNENGTFTNCKFIGNTVNTNGNGAVIYLGFNENVTVKKCLFKDNNVNGTSDRVAGALQVGALNDISENVFVNNNASINGGETVLRQIVEAGYYHAGDLSSNYFSEGNAPVWGTDIVVEYGYYTPAVEDYYSSYSIDADGNVVLSDLKYIVKDIELDFVNVTADGTEGEKIYNINLKAPGKLINRLNSVDLTFTHTEVNGDTDFEIIASNNEVTVNSVNNSKFRYEFHYDGKTATETDTAETITIGQVKFTGYGEFSFAVDTSVDTNTAHATKNEDNIVDTFVPGGNVTLGYGNFDITDNDIANIEITVPARNLEINVDFPNSVENQNIGYQQMTITITGEDLPEAIVAKLGKDYEITVPELDNKNISATDYSVKFENGKYVFEIDKALTLNTSYNVEVSGEGYRTARYTVTMTEDKALDFWNNVKDAKKVIEVGTEADVDLIGKNVTFLAGDIVKDNNINVYDLSAVVSYFGEIKLVESNKTTYAKYDLNRDSKIDSKDVAMVLVSWGK